MVGRLRCQDGEGKAAGVKIGVAIHGTTPASAIAEQARLAESLGFDELWLSEDYFFLGGVSASAIALAATQSIKVGLGVVASVVRHPAVVAMEAATLANAFPGRFELAIGHGVPVWVRQMGLNPKSPLTAFRECVGAIRQLLEGETLNHDGEYFKFRNVSLHEPVRGLAVLGGVVGPKSVDLTGEVADGLVVSVLGGPNYVANVDRRLRAARADHGRGGDFNLPVFALCCLDADSAAAKASLRRVAAFYLAAVGPTDLTGAYGVNDQLEDMIARGGADVVAREMPDDWLEWAGVHGSPDHCLQQIDALSEAGATSVDLLFSPHETVERQMHLAAETLLPRLHRDR